MAVDGRPGLSSLPCFVVRWLACLQQKLFADLCLLTFTSLVKCLWFIVFIVCVLLVVIFWLVCNDVACCRTSLVSFCWFVICLFVCLFIACCSFVVFGCCLLFLVAVC